MCILASTTIFFRKGVHFTNILSLPFSYASFAQSFFVLTIKVCASFLTQESWRKCAHKMLVKLNTGREEAGDGQWL
jgi:hypothetical protein